MSAPIDVLHDAIAALNCPGLLLERVMLAGERLRITRPLPDGSIRYALIIWSEASEELSPGVYSLMISWYRNADLRNNLDGRRYGGLAVTMNIVQRWLVDPCAGWEDLPRE